MDPNNPNYRNTSPYYPIMPNLSQNPTPQNISIDPNHPNFHMIAHLLQNPNPNSSDFANMQQIPSVYNTPNLFASPPFSYSPQQSSSSPQQSSYHPQLSQHLRVPLSQQFSDTPMAHTGGGSSSRMPVTNLASDNDDDEEETENEHVVSSPSKVNKANKDKRRGSRVLPIPWNIGEDKAICYAYLEGGGCVAKGTDQKVSTHWATIHKLYMQAQSENPSTMRPRTVEAVSQRFKRSSRLCSKFSGNYAAANRLQKSGESHGEVMDKEKQLFAADNGHAFKLEHMWNILKIYPKWACEPDNYSQPTESGESSKRSEPHTPRSDDAEHEMVARPPGVKRVKKKGMSQQTSCDVDKLAGAIENFTYTRETEQVFDMNRFEMQREMWNDQKQFAAQRKREKEERRREKEERRRREKEEEYMEKEREHRFTMYSILMEKSSLTPTEIEQFRILHEEFHV